MTVPAALETHYCDLLGLVRPWKTTNIHFDIAAQRLDITLEWRNGNKVPCPEYGKRYGIKDLRALRTWRHVNIRHGGLFKTFPHCRFPHGDCRSESAVTPLNPT